MGIKKLTDKQINWGIGFVSFLIYFALFIYVGLVVYVLLVQLFQFERSNLQTLLNLFFVLPPLHYFLNKNYGRIKRSTTNKKWNIIYFAMSLTTYLYARIVVVAFFSISSYLLIREYQNFTMLIIILLFLFDIATWQFVKAHNYLKEAPLIWKLVILNIAESVLLIPVSYIVYLLMGLLAG